MTILDGKVLAAATYAETGSKVKELAGRGIVPRLAIILVGEHESSKIYIKGKQAAATKVGVATRVHHLPAGTSTADVLTLMAQLRGDAATHGIIVQMPLPAPVDTVAVLAALPPEKDVDGLSPTSLGALVAGNTSEFVPCTPQGCLLLIKKALGENIAGHQAVVIGRSLLVGKPMAHLLMNADCTVTVGHSKTIDLPAISRTADILVVAAGRPGLVRADWVKPGATVIDVGITRQDGRLFGDVDFDSVAPKAAFITPVPGGVGPMTVACLIKNTVYAALRQTTRQEKA